MKTWRIGSLVYNLYDDRQVYIICHPKTLSNGKKVVHFDWLAEQKQIPISQLMWMQESDLQAAIEAGATKVLSY